ncbi:flavodoxin family protein [Candidatus Electrothrix sp.]|uniref:flavodoxin family protein n=1 Tax=Candidatus Electrothrix sp. TaxID=2170559 RepID=UPI004057598F
MNRQLSEKKTVILDGTRHEDKHLAPILTLLIDKVHQQYGDQIQTLKLRKIKLNPCIGCFNCWVRTPGKCINGDAGTDILRAILNCETVIFFTPVVFGGYSSELKKVVDRSLPVLLPFFRKIHDEIHHIARYPFFPRLVGIGVHPSPQQDSSECFKRLIGRNALNFSSQSYSAGVIRSTDSPQDIIYNLDHLLSKHDRFPYEKEVCALPRKADQKTGKLPPHPNALLLIGSPKRKKSSTSSVLGNSLLKKLKQRNWSTTALPIDQKLLYNNKKEFFSAIAKADLIIVTYPLYGDTIPFQITEIFDLIIREKYLFKNRDQKKMIAIANNGFPEPYQNFISLSICRNFAHEFDMTWAGGLALGAGEVLISGQPITGFKGYKGIFRPPLYYIDRALRITAEALSTGHCIPEKAAQLMARKPLPLISYNFWCYLYIKIGSRIAKKEAMEHGIQPVDICSRPINTHSL